MNHIEVLYSPAETAFQLAMHLGPNRQWHDTLKDMRLYRGGWISETPLLPIGTCGGPKYRWTDIQNCINEVRASRGCMRPFEETPVLYEFRVHDENHPHHFWRRRKVKPF